MNMNMNMKLNDVCKLVVIVGVLASGMATAAPALDSAGKCRDNGKFVAAELCKAKTSEVIPNKCRDVKTKKFAKCGAPGTEPVPMTSTK